MTKLQSPVEIRLYGEDIAQVLTDQLCNDFGLLSGLEVVDVRRDAHNSLFILRLLPKQKPLRIIAKKEA